MKKLFVAVLAIAGVVACNNEETVLSVGPSPIAFDGSFVETRALAEDVVDPSITTENITGFDVWGFMDEAAGQIFDREEVTGTKGNFTYVNTQYWVPGHDYYFAAIAPAQSENVTVTDAAADDAYYGLGTIAFNITEGAEDLLYSAVGPIAAPEAGATEAAPVKFEFNHMLSKVKFTFTNGFTNDLAKIDVTNVRMVVPSEGSINVAQEDWWSTNQWVLGDATKEIAFGDACSKLAKGASEFAANERIIFPADATQTYAITFDVVYYQGDVKAYSGTKNGIVEGVALKIGKAYNFKVELNAENIMADGSELLPIVFDVEEVKIWDTNTDDVDVDVLPTLTVNTNEDVTLEADYAIAGSVKLNGADLDGAGHTLFAESTPADNGLIRPAGDVTVKNVTVAAEGQTTADGKTLRAFYINNGGTYELENVTTTGTGYAINVNVSSDAVVLNVTDSILEGWTSYGTTTTATFTGVTFKSGVYNTYRPYGTTVCENCEFTDMIIDLGSQGATNTITFKNCTFNGQPLAAANLTGAEGKNVTIE